MEGKLIKVPQGYYLEEVFEPGTRGSAMPQIFASTYGEGYNKLSLTNCQAIERGYDLEDLATDSADNYDASGNWHVAYELYKAGFQKCLELLGDKKFSEEDMRKAVSRARMCSVIDEYGSVRFHEGDVEIIQSIQQTEWDVEIEMEDCFTENKEVYVDENNAKGNYSTHSKKPKLDSDGCIILKLKQ